MGCLKLAYYKNKSPLKVVHRSFEVNEKSGAGGYGYGFNGKENDNEIKGTGNSVDFGARVYDSRTGRWLSLDPLQAKYPGTSAYVFTLNNPIMYIDPDGRIVTFANEESEKAFIEVYRIASDDFKTKLDALKDSDVEYNVNVNTTTFTSGHTDPNLIGEVSYEFHKEGKGSRVMVEVNDKLDFKLGPLADELTGASQYEEGKMGFALQLDNTVSPIGYDMQDEIETKRNSLQVTEAYIGENEGFGLSEDLKTFKELDAAGTPEKYFSKSKFGKMYIFTNPPNTNSFANKSLGFWMGAYNGYLINGYTFKANVSTTEKDADGNTAISTPGNNIVEMSDPNNPKVK